MTGSTMSDGAAASVRQSRREARAVRRACPQEAIRRASLRPQDASAATAAAAVAAAEAMAKATFRAAKMKTSTAEPADDASEEAERIMPLRMSKREARAVRRVVPKESMRRASIRPDAMAHEAVVQAAKAAYEAGRSSAPAELQGGGAAKAPADVPARPSSADDVVLSPKTQKAVRRLGISQKKAVRLQKASSVDLKHHDLTNIKTAASMDEQQVR